MQIKTGLLFQQILMARDKIRSDITPTPIVKSNDLKTVTGDSVFFKLENLQKTGSFKVRGATNSVLSLSKDQLKRGIIGFSTGNHGLALAYVARVAKIKCVICMSSLVPQEKVVQIRNGKKVTKDKTYFPGYIMIKANLAGEIPHIIKSVTNVIGFLGETKGGEPIPLRQAEVNRMLGKVDELALQEESDMIIPFIHGESVKVIDGPFNGFDGTIEKINEEKRKLEVMVKIFGRKTPLELSYMQVEKI